MGIGESLGHGGHKVKMDVEALRVVLMKAVTCFLTCFASAEAIIADDDKHTKERQHDLTSNINRCMNRCVHALFRATHVCINGHHHDTGQGVV